MIDHGRHIIIIIIIMVWPCGVQLASGPARQGCGGMLSCRVLVRFQIPQDSKTRIVTHTRKRRVCKQTHHAKCYQVLCCDSNTLRLLPGPLLRRRAIRCKEVYYLYCVLYVVASCSSKTAGSKQRQGLHCRKHLRPRAASGGNNTRVKQHDTSTK